MQTRRTVIVALTGVLLGQALLAGCGPAADGSLYIAVAGENLGAADGGPAPASFFAGAQLAVEEFNQNGGVNGRTVAILPPFDDQGDPRTAVQHAQAIADSAALAVIGHSSAETADAAAGVFDLRQVPAFGTQPLPARLTAAHASLFNATYTVEQEAAYVATYLRKVVGEQNAGVIYTSDLYSQALAEQFTRTFHGLGGDVDFSEVIDIDQSSGQPLNAVIANLAALNPDSQGPGTVFIAADPATAADVVIAMRRNGLVYPLAGASNTSNHRFLNLILSQSEVSAQPGYFTDGLLTTRGLIFDSANAYASRFQSEYQARYGINEPGDAVVNGYHAALTLLAAMQRAGVDGSDVAADRARLQAALLSMDRSETGVPGLAGVLYFDPAGNAVEAPRFGLYTNGRLISAMTQFEPLEAPQRVGDLSAQLEAGAVTTVNGEYAYKANVVYAGIDLIDIQDIDLKTSTYKMDFYLWFRHRDGLQEAEFKPEDFVFTNLQEIESQNLIRAETLDGVTYKTYRVIGTFKNEFDFREYPFDRQRLVIEFRNQNATTSLVQYVVDRLGMQYENDELLTQHFLDNGAFNGLYGWNVQRARTQQNVYSTTSTIGDPQNFGRDATTDFSVINLDVEIQRDSLDYVIKSLLPLLITLLLAYIMFYLPLGHSERLAIGSTALLTTAFFHLSLAGSLPEIGYTVAMEFFFYASYAMSALIVLLETISIRLEKQSETERSRGRRQALHAQRERLSLAGRIVYPTILLAVIGAGALVYTGAVDLGARSEPTGRALTDVVREQAAALAGLVPFIAPADVAEADGEEDPAVTLRLRTWRPEDTRPMQVILDAFAAHARQELGRQITVLYEPVVGISYDSILDAQLEKGNGPDLFYVHPYSVEGRISQHLQPLNDLSIQAGFDENRRAAWESDAFSGGDSKTTYAMPYVGVVQAVYYNQGIFDRLDLDVPRTWEEFLLVSQTLLDAGVLPIANGLNSTEDSEMFMSLLPNFVGGESGRKRFMTDEGSNLCFDNYRVIRAFRAIEELRPFLPPNAATIQSSASKELFVKQQAAMLFGGSWDLGYFQDNLVFEWSIFPAPAPEGGTTYVIFQPDVGIGINRSTAHPEEARLFLNWMMSRAAVNLTAENLPGFYPLGKIRITGSSNRYDYQFQRLANRYPTDIRWAYTEISNKSPSGIELFRVNLNRLVKGEITAAAAARNVQAGLGEWYGPAQTCR